MSARFRQGMWWIPLAIVSALGVAAGLYMNRCGVNVEIDSSVYLTAGIRFAHGEGVSLANLLGAPKPMTWFPPLVPWMVAIVEASGVNIRDAFGIFNALAWGAVIAWTGWLARRATDSALGGILAAGTILTSGAMAFVFGMLYSEPPFLLFEIGALAALARWWERPLFRHVALAGSCVAGAWLARYVGATLLIAGALVMLARPGQNWMRRLTMTAVFTAIGAGPIFAWDFWQTHVRHGGSARTLGWHPITMERVREGISTVASFVVPDGSIFPHAPKTILVVALLLVIIGIWLWLAKTREDRALIPALVGICVVFTAIYGAFLIVSISIADSDTPLDARLLSLIAPPGAIVAAWLGSAALRDHGEALKGFTFTVVASLLTLQGISSWRSEVCNPRIVWPPGDTSPTIDALRLIPREAVIFSDGPEAIYMVSRRKTERLPFAPPEKDDMQDLEGEGFKQQLDHLQTALAPNGGWVVYWTKLWGKDPILSEDLLRAAVPINVTKRFEDGVLLHVAARR